MGKIIGYGKLGRSMPLTLDKCGNLGGDVEMVAVVKRMALRHPENTYLLVGRNSGQTPSSVGLPPNVVNMWEKGGAWSDGLHAAMERLQLKGEVLTPERQLRLAAAFDELTFDTFAKLDAMVMWIGQHGTSNTPIPKISDPSVLTKPQDWCAWYSGFMLRGINHWRDTRGPREYEEINLNADARNRHKMRDLKWPLRHPVLAQFNSSKVLKHFRYGDASGFNEWYIPGHTDVAEPGMHTSDTWMSYVQDVYARLEINGLYPDTPFGDLISYNDDWDRPGDFGLFINEARAIGIPPAMSRREIMSKWVLPLEPHFIHGTWSDASMDNLIKYHGLKKWIEPAPWDQYYPRLHSVRCTFTTPSSGSGWATAKPWEAFAAGTVCFFHPAYDSQNHILADANAWLRNWLRVESPEQLAGRIKHLSSESGRKDWHDLVVAQRRHFEEALRDEQYMQMIESRIK